MNNWYKTSEIVSNNVLLLTTTIVGTESVKTNGMYLLLTYVLKMCHFIYFRDSIPSSFRRTRFLGLVPPDSAAGTKLIVCVSLESAIPARIAEPVGTPQSSETIRVTRVNELITLTYPRHVIGTNSSIGVVSSNDYKSSTVIYS